MFRSITNIVRKAYGDPPVLRDLETWAKHTSKLATPDDLIAASVIESFAKDYHSWSLEGTLGSGWDRWGDGLSRSRPTLRNRQKGLTLEFRVDRGVYKLCKGYPYGVEGCSVNGSPLSDRAARTLIKRWAEVSVAVKAAEAAAAKAKADMEANERKWNLAEKLLGMKRNEFGALVPVEQPS